MFRDNTGIEMLSANVALRSGEQQTAQFEVDCLDGYSLFGESVPDVTIELKHVGDVSWTNIETTPYDTSAFDGSTEDFQVRFTAATITTYERQAFSLTLRRP